MTMNAKGKGNRNERKTRDYWYSVYGATIVIKAGASLGAFDLIAIGKDFIDLIQVKSNSWPRPKEREEMKAYHPLIPSIAKILMVRWNDRAKSPLIRQL
jgi:hypothetical protein